MIDVTEVRIAIVVHGDYGDKPVFLSREAFITPTKSRKDSLKSLKRESVFAFKKAFEILCKEAQP